MAPRIEQPFASHGPVAIASSSQSAIKASEREAARAASLAARRPVALARLPCLVGMDRQAGDKRPLGPRLPQGNDFHHLLGAPSQVRQRHANRDFTAVFGNESAVSKRFCTCSATDEAPCVIGEKRKIT